MSNTDRHPHRGWHHPRWGIALMLITVTILASAIFQAEPPKEPSIAPAPATTLQMREAPAPQKGPWLTQLEAALANKEGFQTTLASNKVTCLYFMSHATWNQSILGLVSQILKGNEDRCQVIIVETKYSSRIIPEMLKDLRVGLISRDYPEPDLFRLMDLYQVDGSPQLLILDRDGTRVESRGEDMIRSTDPITVGIWQELLVTGKIDKAELKKKRYHVLEQRFGKTAAWTLYTSPDNQQKPDQFIALGSTLGANGNWSELYQLEELALIGNLQTGGYDYGMLRSAYAAAKEAGRHVKDQSLLQDEQQSPFSDKQQRLLNYVYSGLVEVDPNPEAIAGYWRTLDRIGNYRACIDTIEPLISLGDEKAFAQLEKMLADTTIYSDPQIKKIIAKSVAAKQPDALKISQILKERTQHRGKESIEAIP